MSRAPVELVSLKYTLKQMVVVVVLNSKLVALAQKTLKC